MTLQTLIRRLKTYKPDGLAQAVYVGIPIGKESKCMGVFKEVYHIKGLPVVIKFPKTHSGKLHCISEMKEYRKALKSKKYKKLVPKVYYYDPKTGVSLVEECKVFKETSTIGKSHYKKFLSLYDVNYLDLHAENVGINSKGQYKLIDWGSLWV